MKLFKFFTLISLIVISIVIYIYIGNNKATHDPISNQNNFYKNLDLAINTAKLETNSLQIRDFNNEVEFYLIIDNNPIKVLVSTTKDPFWQISTLQQVVKTVKIKQEKLKLVDLSSRHPYVTFKNN